MDTPSPVSWIFKPESAGTVLAQHTYLSPSSLNRSPHSSAHVQSPLTSQRHTSPMTPRASTMQQLGSPYRAATASPQSGASTARAQSATQSQDLLLPMMPSTEDSKLHATVSGLRFALQETQLQLGHAKHQARTSSTVSCFRNSLSYLQYHTTYMICTLVPHTSRIPATCDKLALPHCLGTCYLLHLHRLLLLASYACTAQTKFALLHMPRTQPLPQHAQQHDS